MFPHYVSMRASLLKGTDVKTCTVISFPYGADTPRIKALAADEAVKRGADEVDVVMNISAFLSGEFGLVRDELAGVVRAARVRGVNMGRGQVIVKAIIETCYLDDKLKRLACKVCEQAGVDFVKTSTGVGPRARPSGTWSCCATAWTRTSASRRRAASARPPTSSAWSAPAPSASAPAPASPS